VLRHLALGRVRGEQSQALLCTLVSLSKDSPVMQAAQTNGNLKEYLAAGHGGVMASLETVCLLAGNRATTPLMGAANQSTPPLGPAVAGKAVSPAALPSMPNTAPPQGSRIPAIAAHTPEFQPKTTSAVSHSAGYDMCRLVWTAFVFVDDHMLRAYKASHSYMCR
jgi:hypothetical protein